MDNKPKTIKCTQKVMRTCKYAAYLDPDRYYCDYLCMNNKRRGCPPDKCDKYEVRVGERKKRKIETYKIGGKLDGIH